jgi:hypothetical protein
MRILAFAAPRDSDGAPTGPAVLLVGTRDEVRRAAAHMGEDVGIWRTASVEADEATMRDLADDVQRLRALLDEEQARLAVWSGEGVPEGWSHRDECLVRRVGDRLARVSYDADESPPAFWEGWDHQIPGTVAAGSRLASVLAALAEAEAWLAAKAGEVEP